MPVSDITARLRAAMIYYDPLQPGGNSQNYSGFYFDPERRVWGDETLVLYNVRGRRVLSPIEIAVKSWE